MNKKIYINGERDPIREIYKERYMWSISERERERQRDTQQNKERCEKRDKWKGIERDFVCPNVQSDVNLVFLNDI